MYNFENTVNYNDNYGYRNTIRKLFNLKTDTQSYGETNGPDNESRDENDYDQEAMMKGMDYVYMITKDEPLMIELYKKAAGQFLSEDVHIGMSVLFSYSYLKEFHACLVEYTKNTAQFNKTNEKYVNILSKA
jgi:hypothetical protein